MCIMLKKFSYFLHMHRKQHQQRPNTITEGVSADIPLAGKRVQSVVLFEKIKSPQKMKRL